MRYCRMAAAILPISLALFVTVPIWMLTRGWLIRAGVLMGFAAILPWCVWLTTIDGELGPGAGIVMMLSALMLILAAVPVIAGVVFKVSRLLSMRRGQAAKVR